MIKCRECAFRRSFFIWRKPTFFFLTNFQIPLFGMPSFHFEKQKELLELSFHHQRCLWAQCKPNHPTLWGLLPVIQNLRRVLCFFFFLFTQRWKIYTNHHKKERGVEKNFGMYFFFFSSKATLMIQSVDLPKWFSCHCTLPWGQMTHNSYLLLHS